MYYIVLSLSVLDGNFIVVLQETDPNRISEEEELQLERSESGAKSAVGFAYICGMHFVFISLTFISRSIVSI